MQKQKDLDRFAGFGDPAKPIDFSFDYDAPAKKEAVEFGEVELYHPAVAKAINTPSVEFGPIEVHVSKAAKPALDSLAGMGDPSDDKPDEGTFRKSATRFKVGDQIRVKSRGDKVATLTYINRAMGKTYSLAASYPGGGSIVGVFDEEDVIAA